jgi:hypothetical protein
MAEPEPVWYSWAEGLAQAAGNAEQSAEDSKLAAIESQTSALASKNAAAGSATEAYNYMQGAGAHANYAGNSAFSAGNSAAIALGHKNDAEASASAAEQAKSDAFLYRDGAQIARTYSEEARDASINAKTGSESARDQSIALRDEAIAARGATVTTGLVDENGHLILTRDDTTETDAGYVVGPPVELSVVDTVTGPPAPGTPGPIGPKGDPGGITLGTVLTSTSNLNTYKTSGVYRLGTTYSGLLALNFPRDTDSGVLVIYERVVGQTLIQEWHSMQLQGKGYYLRHMTNTDVWSIWRFITTTRVDQTAGRAMYQWDDLNNRDQLVWGDTGNRALGMSAITWGAVVTDPDVMLRRMGQYVTLTVTRWTPPTDQMVVPRNILTLPTGFRPGVSMYSLPFVNRATVPKLETVDLVSTGVMTANNASFAAGVNHYFAMTFPTADPWPTTLPGVASGTIPNT